MGKIPEDSGQLFQSQNFSQVNELIRDNEVRIKLLLREQQEKLLVARLESMINQQASISQFVSIKPELDNSAFLRSQTDEDRELILLAADKEFIDSLSLEEQQQAKKIQLALANCEKAMMFEEIRNENDEFIESEEEDDDSEGEEEESREENEIYQNREDDEDENRTNQSSELEDDEDPIPKGDAGGPAVKEMMVLEKVVDDEKDKFTKDVQPCGMNEDFMIADDQKKTETLAHGELVEERRDNKMTDLEEDEQGAKTIQTDKDEEIIEEKEAILPDISPKSIIPFEEEELEYAMDDNDNDYDCIIKAHSKSGNLNENMLMRREIQDALIKFKVIETMKKPHSELEKNNDHVYELMDDILNMFINCDLTVTFNRSDPLYNISNLLLLCKYLICLSLDPAYESVILPVLSFYLIDQDKSSNVDVKAKIVSFLYQYAMRSPSIFFMPFNTSAFSAYLRNKETNLDLSENFSLMDILFSYFISCIKQEEPGFNIKKELVGLITFLLELRLSKSIDGNIPEYIKSIIEKDDLPLRLSLLQNFVSLVEEHPKISEKEGPQYCYSWLKSLASISQYRKTILICCNKLLTATSQRDKGILTNFIEKVKQVLRGEALPLDEMLPLNEHEIIEGLITELTLNLLPILTLLVDILDQFLDDDFNVSEYTSGGLEVIEAKLNEMTLCYMEIIELISKLIEQGKLLNNEGVELKLISLTKIPLQYYFYLTKVNDTKRAIKQVKDKNTNTNSRLTKRFSSLNVAEKLERSYSLLQLDMNNFQETLAQWINKHKDLISKLFHQIDPEAEVMSFYLLVTKKIPWIIGFDAKESYLRYIYFISLINNYYQGRL